jgi:hypothetical protein
MESVLYRTVYRSKNIAPYTINTDLVLKTPFGVNRSVPKMMLTISLIQCPMGYIKLPDPEPS